MLMWRKCIYITVDSVRILTGPADITSCRCQESIVSLALVCNIDGPNSCEGKTAITSNIWEFRNCEAATDILKTTKVGREII